MKEITPPIVLLGLCVAVAAAFAFADKMYVPVTWDTDAIKRIHLPPPDTTVKVSYAPKAYYDSLPEHVIYKTYPVYYREFEKPGYLDSLRSLKPEV
ncbi:MAG TPA: hypothetical protein VEW65_14970, partial [Chryseolinea sp.]|nr:hypothetical protein [Chryseolinea sp.]